MEVAVLVSAPASPTGIGACSVVPTGLRGRARPLVACMLCVAQVDQRYNSEPISRISVYFPYAPEFGKLDRS
jgi:hypothetical protein